MAIFSVGTIVEIGMPAKVCRLRLSSLVGGCGAHGRAAVIKRQAIACRQDMSKQAR
jgi:hypothetical protein